MPDWVFHKVEVISGDLPEFVDGKTLDFNQIIPMPEGLVDTDVSPDLVYEARQALATSHPDAYLKRHVKPELFDEAMVYLRNLEGFGYPTGCAWREQHWGVKWAAQKLSGFQSDSRRFCFGTPYYRPMPIFQALAKRRGLHMVVDYCFEGFPRQGRITISGGKVEDEDLSSTDEGFEIFNLF